MTALMMYNNRIQQRKSWRTGGLIILHKKMCCTLQTCSIDPEMTQWRSSITSTTSAQNNEPARMTLQSTMTLVDVSGQAVVSHNRPASGANPF